MNTYIITHTVYKMYTTTTNNNNKLLWRLSPQEPELRSEQDRIIKHNRDDGRAKVSIRTMDNRTFMVEMQFGIDMS